MLDLFCMLVRELFAIIKRLPAVHRAQVVSLLICGLFLTVWVSGLLYAYAPPLS